MTFAAAIKTCLRKYATFSGRAPRSEFWWFVLFAFLCSVAAGILDTALFTPDHGKEVFRSVQPGDPTTIVVDTGRNDGPLSLTVSLALLVPHLAAGWRRMHDTGRSGLRLLYPLIVMAGMLMFIGLVAGFEPLLAGDTAAVFAGGVGIVMAMAMFVFLISPLLVLWWLTNPSQPGPNSYGPNPHEVTS
ncbi:hypothetical protein OCGS_0217 [Oceaniovalibus guishaninsula JLT2003]|uniref:DUF805 domain-containing protein n=1 Tax=Oceaniovalibus guishaninsula JLT2003 TaxID=1231392 RepID=K2I9F4_9RHOB|nr:DUF805 domain-containing protein [Oceaniovalibus guishaninsula]EKE45600.1 hypothetical protein OCGS_0217 [Oceaniovalibus guishaninsula JLT2003]